MLYFWHVCRLHAKLNEDEEAAKLYNRFVAQAETSDVSILYFADVLSRRHQSLDTVH